MFEWLGKICGHLIHLGSVRPDPVQEEVKKAKLENEANKIERNIIQVSKVVASEKNMLKRQLTNESILGQRIKIDEIRDSLSIREPKWRQIVHKHELSTLKNSSLKETHKRFHNEEIKLHEFPIKRTDDSRFNATIFF